MTFLNPLYLIALAAAAIPILLHLLNLRKTRVVEFSTLTFLKELQRSRIRKLKIRQWILLALRTLIIVFLVLAFTRPALRGSYSFLPGTAARTSVVIVLDDSYSMTSSDDEGQLFKQAKAKAAAILDMLRPGDEAAMIRISDARRENRQFTVALGALRRELDAAEPSYLHVGVGEALTAASALLQKSVNVNREVYVLTDGQRSQFRDGGTHPPTLFDNSVKVFLLPLGARAPENTALVDLTVENSLFEKGQPVQLRAGILNDGDTPISSGIISLFVNGERVVQKTVDVAPGGRASVELTFLPQSTGFLSGMVELEDDALPEDNRRCFSVFIPENLRVLLGPSTGIDAAIAKLALRPAVGENSPAGENSPTGFTLDAADRSTLQSAALSRYDAVVLLGASALPASFLQRLADYVKDGGGALLLPDADGKTEDFARVLLPAFGLPSAEGVAGSIGGRNSQGAFSTVDFDHPLFRGMFRMPDPTKKPEIESPQLFAQLRLRGSEASRVVIGSSAGGPFLLDHRYGNGRVLVLAVSTAPSWSDLPLKGIFVPLMNRAMYYLAAREDNVAPAAVGDVVDVRIPPADAGATSFTLRPPAGATARLVPKSLPSGLRCTVASLERPGVYAVIAGEKTVRTIPVNMPPAESEMARLQPKEREDFFRALGVAQLSTLARDADLRVSITEARFGVELWKYFVALAILCALIEMLVAREAKKKSGATA
jgi:hypothetical protein